MKSLFFAGALVLTAIGSIQAQPLNQKPKFTRQDTLRGSLNAERTGWNVTYYDVSVTPNYEAKTIEGKNIISFKVIKPFKVMQIDLQEPMNINQILWNGKKLNYTREGNAFHVSFPSKLIAGKSEKIEISFAGNPRIAVRPPWDGGWIFTKDKKGRPWMSVACQGLGASVWYPCKDHQSDEPDNGATLRMTVPDSLVAVAMGRLKSTVKNSNGTTTYSWSVVNPINNYNIIPYIGKYAHWHEEFKGEKGNLDCDYWVMDYELERAQQQFKQAPIMLKSFEYWFGPYPWYEDGYKLVESPHLGMEHQSAVAYGNNYGNGYRGRDLSGSGWGLKWDFIIIHESGHEWFANNVTSNDIADMWVHEGFTNYSETLFTTSEYGVEAGNDYVIGTRKLISNDIPIIGYYGVNQEGSGDMYYKGGNLLHTIRNVIGSDSVFRAILRGIQRKWYHKTVDSKDIEAFFSQQSKIDFSTVFDQYLRTTKIPTLEWYVKEGKAFYRWTNTIPKFSMRIKMQLKDGFKWIVPTENWQSVELQSGVDSLTIDRNFYIKTAAVAAQ